MSGRPASGLFAAMVAIVLAALLAGCSIGGVAKDLKPVPPALTLSMREKNMDQKAPILIRIFKEDSQLEVWKQARDGTYGLLKTYSICSWSGTLGPKKVEGDMQAPEGFYTVTPAQMNPDSNYYLSFNIGYPNTFDQALGRTGSNLMVHGACSSAGCYSMTDESAGEIFALARDAFEGGQRDFQIQAFPFRMTAENMAKYYDNANIDFWRMLKVGYDSFELTHTPPKVDVCNKQYVFNATPNSGSFNPTAKCPDYTVPEPLATALAKKQSDDDARITQLVALKSPVSNPNGSTGNAVAQVIPTQPSLLSRLGLAPAPAAPTTSASVTPTTASSAPATITTGTATKPAATQTAAPAANTAKPGAVTNPAVAANQPASAAKTTPTATATSPPVGVFVERKFWWDDLVTLAVPGST